ncbi:unnamed protein product [Schistosoma rodhaini]|uniref:Uncharacterized protein n=1 Tax=Schistosoma rodhaini TaxID=6188 RepID=A0AA85GM31_9TREM|nr:unnamed protein product [Schistosoma rodhaini]
MKTCFVQALVLTIYILGVQYLVTADNTSLELEDAYFKLNKYTEAIKTVEREKIYIEELVLYATNTTEKQFRDDIIPNDRDLLQTYSENYKRVPEISRNLDDYYYGSVEYAIMIKWDARLNFDLATNKYLNMLASTKNSSLTASNESVEKNLWKSNPKRDLVQTEKEARNTSDSNKRGILEREIEDLINGINALEASPVFKAADEKNLDTTDKFHKALNDHLEILKNLEIRRIDVLELLSSKERIQMYESILQVELNSI